MSEVSRILGPGDGRRAEILTPEALDFVAALQREFGDRKSVV